MFWMVIENKDDRLKVERLYYKYRNLMYKEAYEILEDTYLAEDAVAESFIRIINRKNAEIFPQSTTQIIKEKKIESGKSGGYCTACCGNLYGYHHFQRRSMAC